MSYHRTVIMGALGRDVETRYTSNGEAIANFSVAVSEKYKEQERTTWYRVSVFGKQAEIAAKYLAKGSSVLIEGRMNENKYTSKDGIEKTSWELRCDNLRLVGGKPDKSERPAQEPAKAEPQGSGFEDFSDDIPW